MKKVIIALFVLMLLSSCAFVTTSESLYMVNKNSNVRNVDIKVISNGITDSHACFSVAITNNSNQGFYFSEGQISFWAGNYYSDQWSYLGNWSSTKYYKELRSEQESKLVLSSIVGEVLTADAESYDQVNDTDLSDLVEFVSFANTMALGIKGSSTLENVRTNMLQTCYIPAGQTAYGLVFFRDDYPNAQMFKIVVNVNNQYSEFTFSR